MVKQKLIDQVRDLARIKHYISMLFSGKQKNSYYYKLVNGAN